MEARVSLSLNAPGLCVSLQPSQVEDALSGEEDKEEEGGDGAEGDGIIGRVIGHLSRRKNSIKAKIEKQKEKYNKDKKPPKM